MNIIGVQRKVFYLGVSVTSYALYDLFLDISNNNIYIDKDLLINREGLFRKEI